MRPWCRRGSRCPSRWRRAGSRAEAGLERVEVLGGRKHIVISGEVVRARRGLGDGALGAEFGEVVVRDTGAVVERIGTSHSGASWHARSAAHGGRAAQSFSP